MLALLMVLVSIVPHDEVVYDQADLVELNHFHDDQGRPVFDQYLFYDFCPIASRYQVIAWRMAKSPGQLPCRDHKEGGYVCNWTDSQSGNCIRRIKIQCVRESWTMYDPELVERQFLAKEKRRELKIPGSLINKITLPKLEPPGL